MGRGQIWASRKRASRKRMMQRGPVYPKWMLAGTWPDGEGPICTPGRIDHVARFLYRDRQSAFLALVLHDKTGGQIWAALNRSDKEGYPSPVPGHFGVETSPDQITDIDGTRRKSLWKKELASEIMPLSKEELRAWQGEHQQRGQWLRSPSFQEQYNLALTFADQLL